MGCFIEERKKWGYLREGFKRSSALIDSEQSRTGDKRVNMKSGLQRGPRVFFAARPQSRAGREMMCTEMPYLKFCTRARNQGCFSVSKD